MSEIKIKPGDFPFPITEGSRESRYLTWVRNHSNYMAVRGLFDYFRAVGVLLRGVLVNFLIFVPYLLGVSLAVATSNFLQAPPPFILTKSLLILAVAWILIFPLLMPLFRIVRYQKSRSTGSDSSVEQRDRYERSFGAFLLAILAIAAFESLPGLLNVFHDLLYGSDVGWPALVSIITVTSAIFGVVPKLVSALGGVARNLALAAIAALGVLVPLLFVLFVSHFLVFGPVGDWTIWAAVASYVFPAGILLALLLGLRFHAFKRKDFLNISLLGTTAVGLVWFGVYADKLVFESYIDKTVAVREEAIIELAKHPLELKKLAIDMEGRSGPQLKKLDDDLLGFRKYLVQKHDFFAQLPSYPNSNLKKPSEYLEDYREYRARKVAFYQLDVEPDPSSGALLKELLRELLEELANEARHVEGLSALVTLARTINPLVKEESTALLNEVYNLYIRVATLRDLYRPRPLSELAATLITVPNKDLDRRYPLLEKLHKRELAGAQESLDVWDSRLKEVRDELDTLAPHSPNFEFFGLIENVEKQARPRLDQLNEYLEEHRQDTSQQRYLFSRGPVAPDQLEELLEEMVSLGYDAGLYPELGELVEAIRRTLPVENPNALMRDLHLLYSTSDTLRNLFRPRPLRELVTNLIALPKEDIDRLSKGDTDIYPDYTLLQKFGEFEGVQDTLEVWGAKSHRARRELVATASLSLSDSAFSATPVAGRVRVNAFWPKLFFVAMFAVQLWFLCWLTVDVNLTSIHGLYRDRLASAFLVGEDTKGDIDIEKDLDLMEICNHEAGSTAPYHLINVALNLQGSKDMGIRDRQSDFFIFSKKFIGGKRTGYCRSETMERVFPQMDLATAMAISAAAASPNMGRGTSPALVAVMTLLNVRLGFWVPNPGLVENWLARIQGKQEGEERKPGGFSFNQVFRDELKEIEARWQQLPPNGSERHLATDHENDRKLQPTLKHGLVGIGYSGGGIRSATVNLGITQALHQRGVFDHVDYMSTVSGGGYLGSSISTLMRRKNQIGDTAKTPHAKITEKEDETQNSVGQIFRWRVRPAALVREILSKLDETSRLVNVSDGGHIENLAGIELLRRRCQYIIIGDGEADPNHHFNGLATLIQTARIDLGIDIEINADPLRLSKKGLCRAHWAIGRIRYPNEVERGYLLYLKSSVTGDEDEVIKQYRHRSPSFPHETTADQFFGEGQFEAYRSLGQHIGERVLERDTGRGDLVSSPLSETS